MATAVESVPVRRVLTALPSITAAVLPPRTLRIGTIATAPETGKMATPPVTALARTACCEVATTPRPRTLRAVMASEGWAALGSVAVLRSKAVTSWPAW